MKVFIFDLDGTLLNTLEDIGNACNEVLARYGYPAHSIGAYRQMVGNGFNMLVRRALPQSENPANLDQIVAEARECYAEHMLDATRPYQGMEETLAALSRNALLAVLSNKPDGMCGTLINHYFGKIPFAHVAGAREGMPLKPDPQALSSILDSMGVDKALACYVGDSNVDVETGHNAGIKAVGAAWGFRGAEELREAHADAILDTPADLLKLI